MDLEYAVEDEQLVVSYLRGRAEVKAIVGGRVSSDFPEQTGLPRVRVTRTGGTSPWPQHLDHPRHYFECYGNTKAEAKSLAFIVRAVLRDLPGLHAEGTVTSADEVVGPAFVPDRATARRAGAPRYVFSFEFTIHPNG